jgi:hypothetical protein
MSESGVRSDEFVGDGSYHAQVRLRERANVAPVIVSLRQAARNKNLGSADRPQATPSADHGAGSSATRIPTPGQWFATFERRPQVAFGGDMPAVAIRRLLEGTEAEPGDYALICDADLSGTGAHTIYRSIIWNPPELLLPCGDCRGKGEYVGLLERGTCKTCGGRKVVPL